jgi:hypothetical protein
MTSIPNAVVHDGLWGAKFVVVAQCRCGPRSIGTSAAGSVAQQKTRRQSTAAVLSNLRRVSGDEVKLKMDSADLDFGFRMFRYTYSSSERIRATLTAITYETYPQAATISKLLPCSAAQGPGGARIWLHDATPRYFLRRIRLYIELRLHYFVLPRRR